MTATTATVIATSPGVTGTTASVPQETGEIQIRVEIVRELRETHPCRIVIKRAGLDYGLRREYEPGAI
ncbi:hypothetical protein D8S78_13135 [Natrialba swarupiae]|nr:hypothetical protein [Natrialba swarupiae]